MRYSGTTWRMPRPTSRCFMITKGLPPFSGAKVFAIMGTLPWPQAGRVHAARRPVYPLHSSPDRTVWQRGLTKSKSYLHIDTIGFKRHVSC